MLRSHSARLANSGYTFLDGSTVASRTTSVVEVGTDAQKDKKRNQKSGGVAGHEFVSGIRECGVQLDPCRLVRQVKQFGG